MSSPTGRTRFLRGTWLVVGLCMVLFPRAASAFDELQVNTYENGQ
jgi:hypothetical protein